MNDTTATPAPALAPASDRHAFAVSSRVDDILLKLLDRIEYEFDTNGEPQLGLSVSISVKGDKSGIAGLQAGPLKAAARRALSKAGQTAQRDMRGEASKRIRKRMRLKSKYITRAPSLHTSLGSDLADLSWSLDVSGKPVPLIAYPTARSWGAPAMLNGHEGIFRRRGTARLPIEELLGSRPVDALLHQGEADAVAERGGRSFSETFTRAAAARGGQVMTRKLTAQHDSLGIMMGIREDWAVLRARLEAVVEAAALVTALRDIPPSFIEGAVLLIVEDCKRLWGAISLFLTTHRTSLPPAAGMLMNDWQQQRDAIPTATAIETPVKVTIGWVLLLASIKGNVDWLLADSEAVWRSTTERAFEHLQRTIVVDPDAMQRWKAAFDDDEPACERLGATHLLWHGIWGFKVHAEGERTDLVLGEVIDTAAIERAARAGTALVLTEWKRVRKQLTVADAKDAIERQVQRYRRGSLAGVELKRTCYGVLVSEKHVSLSDLSDRSFPDFALRFVNLVVDPDTPSAKPAVRARAGGS